MLWAEQCIEIAKDATSDYTTDEHGNRVFDQENVHRVKLRIDALQKRQPEVPGTGLGAGLVKTSGQYN